MVSSSIVVDVLMIVEPMSCMHSTKAVSVVMNQSLSRVGGWDKKCPLSIRSVERHRREGRRPVSFFMLKERKCLLLEAGTCRSRAAEPTVATTRRELIFHNAPSGHCGLTKCSEQHRLTRLRLTVSFIAGCRWMETTRQSTPQPLAVH